MKIRVRLPLRLLRGALGKKIVIKHYSYGAIKTKYPDMTRIIASLEQRKCRNTFRDAVAFAKEVIADKQRKKEWQRRIRRRKGVYNAAIKFYLKKDKLAKEKELILANNLLIKAMRREDAVAVEEMPRCFEQLVTPAPVNIFGGYSLPLPEV